MEMKLKLDYITQQGNAYIHKGKETWKNKEVE